MKLIVGLGNPGIQYALTRHNVGFMVVDHLVIRNSLGEFKEDFYGAYLKTKINNETYIIYKPYTYMNDSGRGIRAIVDFFKIDLEDILVIHDDLDLPCGKVRIRKNGGSGGHNGIKSVIEHLGSEDFKRIRIGIAKPENHEIINYVLGKLTNDEVPPIKEALEIASKAIIDWSNNTFDIVMNKYNVN